MYKYVESTATFYAIPVGGTEADGTDGSVVPQEYFYEPNCPGNPPPAADGTTSDELCVGAITACPPGQLQMEVFQRNAGTEDPPKEIAVQCIGGAPTITLAHLITDLFPRLKVDIDSTEVTMSTIDISPPTLALVNLPVIAATQLTPANLHITDPLEADVQITPVPTWDFGDGSPTVTGPVGLKYDGTSALADPGHYPLTHTYRKPGSHTVTLSVLWTAVSVTTAEHPAPIPLPDPHPTATTTTTVVVDAHEAHAVLVS